MLQARGGVEGIRPEVPPPPREVYLLQRKRTKVGAGLGKTSGWVHRLTLANKHVCFHPAATGTRSHFARDALLPHRGVEIGFEQQHFW